jgi:ketosteroid isomerase-like protein
MNRIIFCGSIFLLIFLSTNSRADSSNKKVTAAQFESLMHTVAEGWNAGDAKKATDCFTEDAVYIEPPSKQLYRGRAALFKFFGGEEGRKSEMKMTWHHLMFNQSEQTGAGEFTFEYGSKVHGMVIVKLIGGKIHRWREYWYESDMDWETFIGDSQFPNE